MSFKARLISRIKDGGPITVAEYMALCLLDPVDGYYPTRDPLGSDGDFITAPEISQMFGEVLGLWVIQSWQDMGRPDPFTLAELGPGRGIMMADILRAVQLAPDCLAAMRVSLIEASAALEAVQARTLAEAPAPVSWAKDLSELPDMPLIIIGNEYLDCLPIRQFIQNDPFAGAAGWYERLVSLDEEDRLTFARSPAPIPEPLQVMLPAGHEDARKDDLLEVNLSAHLLINQIADIFKTRKGRALFIDYGPETTEFGDTLQALKRHEKVGVFSDPGNTDLTARVDFEALAGFAETAGLAVSPSVTQQTFLSRLGIEMRAATLARAQPEAKEKLARQLHRLMDSEQMGTLFRVVCLQSKGLPGVLGLQN